MDPERQQTREDRGRHWPRKVAGLSAWSAPSQGAFCPQRRAPCTLPLPAPSYPSLSWFRARLLVAYPFAPGSARHRPARLRAEFVVYARLHPSPPCAARARTNIPEVVRGAVPRVPRAPSPPAARPLQPQVRTGPAPVGRWPAPTHLLERSLCLAEAESREIKQGTYTVWLVHAR